MFAENPSKKRGFPVSWNIDNIAENYTELNKIEFETKVPGLAMVLVIRFTSIDNQKVTALRISSQFKSVFPLSTEFLLLEALLYRKPLWLI